MAVDSGASGRLSWDRMYALRRAVRARFPDPLRLPRVRRPESLIAARLAEGANLLDVGAGDGKLAEKLRREGRHVAHTAVDPAGPSALRSLDEAEGSFDAACLLEVVEHLSPDAGMALVRHTRAKLVPGGWLFLSTPNVFKPGQFHRDAAHRTAYCWEELGALLLAAGCELEGLYRVYNAPLLSRVLHLGLLWPLHRFLGVDCARSVMAAGRKGG
jgi:2-polyprenyl-3-methyl-5-hydroxy-6-metoxy-1,4-benzoquinol methylase